MSQLSKQFGLEIPTLFYVSLEILNKVFLFLFLFFYATKQNLKGDLAPADPSFVNKQTSH